jgi:hypothetical protein
VLDQFPKKQRIAKMIDIPKHPNAEPNRKQYIEILQKMTGEERVRIAFELFEMAKDIMIEGMKAQNPKITLEEIQKEVVRRMMLCHRMNSLGRSYKFLTG